MTIAILGTGDVGRTLAARLAELGRPVVLGTRDPETTRGRPVNESASMEDWLAAHPGVSLATFAEAAAAAPELVIHAANGASALDVLRAAGSANLAGKVLLDVSNPLDFSAGFPPRLFTDSTESLAERIQAAFPDTRVVKSLNTVTAALMVRPDTLADGAHTIFVSGDDAAAKHLVTELLRELGHSDVLDLGELASARGPELYLPLWLRLYQVFGRAEFGIKVVR